MKRKYVVPEINIEHYALTQSIAACAVKIGLLDSACVIDDPDATLGMKYLAYDDYFLEGCNEVPEGVDPATGICYHTNAQAAFNS